MTNTTNSGAAATENAPCANCGRCPGDPEYCDWIECAALSPAPAAATQATSGDAEIAAWEGLMDMFAVIMRHHGIEEIRVNDGSDSERFPQALAEFIVAAHRASAVPTPAAPAAGINTWQERCNWNSDEPATKLMVEAMKAEIADLRAALAAAQGVR